MNGTSTATITQDIPLVEFSFDLPLDEPASVPQPLTFDQLCEIEPRLLALYNEAKSIRDDKRKLYFCANRIWYSWHGLRERMFQLVGFAVKRRGGDPRLATSRAYDIAYHTIYQALPDCRACACWGFQELVNERMGRKGRRYY